MTNGGNATALFHDVVGELVTEYGLRMPPPPAPMDDPPRLNDPDAYVGVYERAGSRIDVARRGAGLTAMQTVTGPGAAMTPDPFEMPLVPHDPALDLFLTRHPAAPGMWLPAMFLTLPDGSRSLHVAGRATPKVD